MDRATVDRYLAKLDAEKEQRAAKLAQLNDELSLAQIEQKALSGLDVADADTANGCSFARGPRIKDLRRDSSILEQEIGAIDKLVAEVNRLYPPPPPLPAV